VFCLHTDCLLDLLSWGYSNKQTYGHIIVNKEILLSTCSAYQCHTPGVTLAVLALETCMMTRIQSISTYSSYDDTTPLIKYISTVTNGSIIVGVTLTQMSRYLAPAFPQLTSFGVNTSYVNVQSSFAFVAQVFGGQGQPGHVAVTEPNGSNGAHMIVRVQGLLVVFFDTNCNFT